MTAFRRRIREHVALLDHKDQIFSTWAGKDGVLAKWCQVQLQVAEKGVH